MRFIHIIYLLKKTKPHIKPQNKEFNNIKLYNNIIRLHSEDFKKRIKSSKTFF